MLGLALLNAEPTDSKDESVKLSFQVLEGGKGGGGIEVRLWEVWRVLRKVGEVEEREGD